MIFIFNLPFVDCVEREAHCKLLFCPMSEFLTKEFEPGGEYLEVFLTYYIITIGWLLNGMARRPLMFTYMNVVGCLLFIFKFSEIPQLIKWFENFRHSSSYLVKYVPS